MACQNAHYVNESDKESLRRGGVMDRMHMQYLLCEDPQLRAMTSHMKVDVQTAIVEHSYGLVHRTPDQIIELHEKVSKFVQNKDRE